LRLTPLGYKGRNRGLFCGLALAAAAWASPASAFDCSAPALGAHAGLVRSQWEESNAQGRLLVRERGTLRRAGVTVDGDCERWQWRLALTRSTGERAYDGVSNNNFPIQTTSGLAITDASAQLWTPAVASWSGGLRVNHRELNRDIASIGQVRGYPERFSYWQAAVGLKHELALTPDVIVSGEGWLGGGAAGTLALSLPTADAAQLTLGSSKLAEIGLQIGSPVLAAGQAGWSWHARVDYQRQAIAAGPAKALMRNGIPVGGAAQPAIRQQALGIGAGVQLRF
jgi:hypothetical protein